MNNRADRHGGCRATWKKGAVGRKGETNKDLNVKKEESRHNGGGRKSRGRVCVRVMDREWDRKGIEMEV